MASSIGDFWPRRELRLEPQAEGTGCCMAAMPRKVFAYSLGFSKAATLRTNGGRDKQQMSSPQAARLEACVAGGASDRERRTREGAGGGKQELGCGCRCVLWRCWNSGGMSNSPGGCPKAAGFHVAVAFKSDVTSVGGSMRSALSLVSVDFSGRGAKGGGKASGITSAPRLVGLGGRPESATLAITT